MAKEYTVICYRRGRETRYTGTVEYLVNNVFGYTLECGKSWEYEKGNSKINVNPTTARSLVSNLNKAVTNSAANGCPSEYFELA